MSFDSEKTAFHTHPPPHVRFHRQTDDADTQTELDIYQCLFASTEIPESVCQYNITIW